MAKEKVAAQVPEGQAPPISNRRVDLENWLAGRCTAGGVLCCRVAVRARCGVWKICPLWRGSGGRHAVPFHVEHRVGMRGWVSFAVAGIGARPLHCGHSRRCRHPLDDERPGARAPASCLCPHDSLFAHALHRDGVGVCKWIHALGDGDVCGGIASGGRRSLLFCACGHSAWFPPECLGAEWAGDCMHAPVLGNPAAGLCRSDHRQHLTGAYCGRIGDFVRRTLWGRSGRGHRRNRSGDPVQPGDDGAELCLRRICAGRADGGRVFPRRAAGLGCGICCGERRRVTPGGKPGCRDQRAI